ncbi:VTT domain-containing protein [Arthrobacter sp. B1805]|uniref:VTT domain-containing protein n=1 Tax=Arthrobacter sp. B1805 TaxID=2058892 RepID=UPI000CE2E63A|nr:VTT domain-containing protein [Arthrobacter sp. B1805]
MMTWIGGGIPTGISLADIADPAALLQGAGGWVLAVVAVIVFIESGVLFPFLPGDSLIFTAGLLHVRLGLPLAVLIAVIVSAAILGDQVGYWLGRRFGRRLFTPDARILNTRYLTGAEEFFTRYGGRSLVLARFVPFARTFVPLAAGTAQYRYRAFLMWNVLGAVLWGAGLTVAGSLLGGVPFIADHIDLIALVIVVVSVVPTILEVVRHIRKNKAGTGRGPAVELPEPTVPDDAPTGASDSRPAAVSSMESIADIDRRPGELP